MTPKNDETATSGTLPPHELNPLLNPTLNKHLGRWAEVYFTNPPEKRDEAVVNLLRELESEPTAADGVERPFSPRKIQSGRSVVSPDALTCDECGFENELDQKFCGECGAPLLMPFSTIASNAAASTAERAGSAEIETESRSSERIESAVPQFGSILNLSGPSTHRITGVSRDSSEPDFMAGYVEATPLKRSYRFYIAAVLALVIGGLAYVAWRGGQFAPAASVLPAPAPPAASQPASSPAPAASSPAPVEPSPSTPPDAKSAAIAEQKSEIPAKLVPPPESTPNSGNSAERGGSGSQELALAQSLLAGAGKPRDSATAAEWLWKAVQKQNTAATVLLAGLYLRGDGVPKNCDQGRILLDAAAVKGNKEAATLLRNLQAFGCQ